MTASYPGSVKTFSTHVNVTEIIDAGHPNALQEEVAAIENTIGTSPTVATAATATGWANTATDYGTINARLANIEKGVVADAHTQYIKNSVITTAGDLLVGTGSAAVGRIGIGTNGYVLTSNGTTAVWAQVQGLTGSQGLLGVQGTQGLQGPQGAQGVQGFGFAQSQGTQGLQGPQGIQGASLSTGAGVSTFLATPTSANLATAVTDETGSGSLVFGTSPTLADPKINIYINARTASYTPSASDVSDNGKLITMSVGSANTFSIPTNANNAYSIGTQILVVQIGTGQTTIQAVTSGTTTIASNAATSNAPKLRTQYSSATCIKVATDTWYVLGDIV